MKANELMIGDWVYCFDPDEPNDKQTNKVSAIRVEYNEGAIKFEQFTDWFEEGWFEPIPLTPEILEKNGIILEDAQFAVANYALINRAENDDVIMDYIGVAKDRGDWWVTIMTAPALISSHNCSYRRRLEYVHEFQLALRACGYIKFANNLKV